MAKINKKVMFSFYEDNEYEVTVVSYNSPDPGDFETAPDSGEIDFSPTVNVMTDDRKTGEITFDDFISCYAEALGVSRESADELVRDHAMLDIAEQFMDEVDDVDEMRLEERW